MLVWHQNEQEVKCEIFTFISCSKRKHESLQQMHLLWRTLMKCSTGFVCSLSDWLETNQNNWNQSFRKEKKKRGGDCALFLTLGDSGKGVNYICKLGFMLDYMVDMLSHFAQIFCQMLLRCLYESNVQMRLMFSTVDLASSRLSQIWWILSNPKREFYQNLAFRLESQLFLAYYPIL